MPNLLIDHAMRNTHVPPGFWRGVNINQNAIFLECFMDELAQAAGQDPLEFRRKLMSKHPKHLAVLNAVADRAGWGKPAPQGVHRGLAQMMAFGSYVAACAEISVTGGDKVKVHRIVCATDPGYAVNPAQIERQIAGSFVYGLSALFMEECTVKDGRIEQTNFNTYDSMRIAQMPKVESIIMPSGGFWGGVGEPTICVAAPAVLNAYLRRRRASASARSRSRTTASRWCKRCVSAVAAAIACACDRRGHRAASAEPPAGAAACSGCHPRLGARAVARPAARRARSAPRSSRPCRTSARAQRTGTVMDRIAKGFTDAEIQAIAAWYAAQR